MPGNIIESYLVKLGVAVDVPGFNQFQTVLKHADTTVAKYTEGFIANALKFQIAATSAFATVGAAAVGMAVHVANADQEYRLLGLHMYMTQGAARNMKIVMDALGASMGDIAWDPELNARYFKGQEVAVQMSKQLGLNYEKNQKQIRDIEFEFQKLFLIEGKFAAMELANTIFARLGFGAGDLEKKLQGLNSWFISMAPSIIDNLSNRLMPVLRDIKDVLKDTWSGLEMAGTLFTNFVGLLSGDTSLDGTKFKFDNFATAIGDVSHAIAIMVMNMVLAEKVLAHLADAAVLAAGGHMKDAAKELKAGLADITPGSLGTLYSGIGAVAGMVAGGPVGAVGGALAGAGVGDLFGNLKQHFFPSTAGNPDYAGLADSKTRFAMEQTIRTAAANYGGSQSKDWERLLRAIIGVESAGNTNAVSPKGAQGLMQLMPGTARQYGVGNPFDPAQNISGGAHYLSDLLKHYQGDVRKAVAAYNEGPGAFDSGKMYAETQKYVLQVMGAYLGTSGKDQSSNSVNTGDIHVHVQSNVNAHEIGRAVVDAITTSSNRQNQRGAAQLEGSNAYAH